MPSTAELMAAIVVANNSLVDLIWQQAQAKELEEQEVKDAARLAIMLNTRKQQEPKVPPPIKVSQGLLGAI